MITRSRLWRQESYLDVEDAEPQVGRAARAVKQGTFGRRDLIEAKSERVVATARRYAESIVLKPVRDHDWRQGQRDCHGTSEGSVQIVFCGAAQRCRDRIAGPRA